MFLLKRDYSNKNFIIKGLISSIFLSSFIYLSYFNIEYKILNTILGLFALYFLLVIPRKALFVNGFFTGILWCWWMAVSLQYYDLTALAPVILICLGLSFAIMFSCFALYDRLTFRILTIFGFTFFAPFGFNWMKFELLFIDSYIGTGKIELLLVLISFYFMIKLKRLKILAIIPLLFSLSCEKGLYIENPNAKIYMPQMNINQNLRWDKQYKATLDEQNFSEINNGINQQKDLVVLPETAFTTVLNRNIALLQRLKDLSYKIDSDLRTIFINGGKKHKLRAGDILGALTAGIGLQKDDIGKIDILDFASYVAINKEKISFVLEKLSKEKRKGYPEKEI